MIRIEPGTANLAAAYEQLVIAAVRAADAAGFEGRTVYLADLYRPDRGIFATTSVYRNYDGTVAVYGIASAIASAAASSGATPSQCATDGLATAGASLRWWRWEARPAALLVGVIDSGARPVAYSGCGDLGARYGGDTAAWASYWDGTLERDRTRFALLATTEASSTEWQRAQCLAVAAFPRTGLDVIAASETTRFYDPWQTALAAAAPSITGFSARQDLCAAIGGGLASDLAVRLAAWRVALGIPAP
jgi:hypothetical protein